MLQLGLNIVEQWRRIFLTIMLRSNVMTQLSFMLHLCAIVCNSYGNTRQSASAEASRATNKMEENNYELVPRNKRVRRLVVCVVAFK